MVTKKLTFKDIMSFSPENEEIFEELSNLCTNNMIVPYIGAGLSVFARYLPIFKGRFLFPTWEHLIDTLYKECINKKRTVGEIEAADEIEDKLGKEDFYKRLYDIFGGSLSKQEWDEIIIESKNQAISIIPKLFHCPIVTTNFDQILEKIHNNEILISFPYKSEKTEDWIKAIDNRTRLIYKIHGCVSEYKKIVLAKNKYEEVYREDSDLVKSLSKFTQGFHFLFLGCSLKLDKDKDYSTDLIEKLQEKGGMYHFAILDCTKDQLSVRRRELKERNIHPILFEKDKYESVKIILDRIFKIYKNRLFQIPQYNLQDDSPYIEREDSIIEKIKNKLSDTGFSVCAITGSGGVGKTRIMSEYAHKVKTSMKIFWFSAISADYIKEEIRQFTLERELIKETEKNKNYIFQVFKNWMIENENWLFLLDNVERYEDIEVFLDVGNMPIGKRHILLTSRNEENETHDIQTIELEVFNKNESLIFLEKHTYQESDEYAEKIAEYLGGLPLALEQASAYIREENKSYKEYYELLKKDGIILRLEKKRLSHTESVGATWNISIQRITNEGTHMLYLCSYMASENINETLFIENSKLLPSSLGEIMVDSLKKNEVWNQLTRYSLLKKKVNGKDYSMHRLLQEVVRNKIGNDPKWAQCCLSLFYKSYEFKYGNIESHKRFLNLTPHVETFLNAAISVLTDKEQEKIAYLYHMGGSGNRNLGNYNYALEWCRNALTIYEKTLGKEHPSTATVYNDMAVIFQDLSNYDKALEYYDYALAIREKTLGKEHPNTATTYNNMAAIFKDLSNYDRALEYYGYALAIRKKALGNEHLDTAITYNNMALVFQDLGDYDKVLNYCDYALKIFKKVLGKKHPDTATTYNNMAEAFRAQGDYDKALEYCDYALKISEKILGKKHPDTATIYNNMALTFHTQGDHTKALKYYGYALSIYEKVLGKGHPNTASAYNNMAEAFRAQGDYDRALEYYGYALDCEKILGKEHPDIAIIYNNMALVFHAQGDYDKALECYVRAFCVFFNKLGIKHPNTKKVLKNLVQAYSLSAKTMDFEKWFEEQLQKHNYAQKAK